MLHTTCLPALEVPTKGSAEQTLFSVFKHRQKDRHDANFNNNLSVNRQRNVSCLHGLYYQLL